MGTQDYDIALSPRYGSRITYWVLVTAITDSARRINLGFDSIAGTSGFQCRSLRDVELTQSLIIGSEPWKQDPGLLPLPWKRQETLAGKGADGKVRVGFMLHDGHVRPHPPIKRGLQALRAALEADPALEVVEYGM